MAQDVQIIDIRRSYVPIDPNAFPVTMLDSGGEDSPESRVPVVPYDGYNFMPTPQGYASYFGVNSTLAIATLVASGGTGKVDDIFMIQTITLDNVLIALCDDGIWTKSATVAGNWTHTITLPVPPVGTHLNWSKCVLENEIIAYRQGDVGHYKATPTNGYIFTLEIPTFLNMAGQLGIFKAGGRLGYWDSENSIAWSGLGFTQDFVPDLETLAGNTIFQDIVGKIVVCLQHGTGFIVYCTKSIVAVSRNVGSPMLWQGKSLFNNNGISYREEVVYSEPDVTHFAFTTQGIAQISGQITTSGSSIAAGEFISPEVATYMKEKRQPVFLQILNGRYLFFKMTDPYYMNGEIAFHREEIPENTLTFGSAVQAIDQVSVTQDTTKAMLAVEDSWDTYWIKKNLGKDSYKDANAVGSVPIWETHIASNVPIATLNAFKTTGFNGSGSYTYFTDVPFADGAITRIDGSVEYFLPTPSRSLKKVAGYAPADTVLDTGFQGLWNKQMFIWFEEYDYIEKWLDAVQYRKVHNPPNPVNKVVYQSTPAPSNAGAFYSEHVFGTFVDLSYFSESNTYYGSNQKSAWAQRSLIKCFNVKVADTKTVQWTGSNTPLPWVFTGASNPSGYVVLAPPNALKPLTFLQITRNSYAALTAPSSVPQLIGHKYHTGGGFGNDHPITGAQIISITEDKAGVKVSNTERTITMKMRLTVTYGGGPVDPSPTVDVDGLFRCYKEVAFTPDPNYTPYWAMSAADGWNNNFYFDLPAGLDIFRAQEYTTQLFHRPEIEYLDLPPCQIKNLGYTKIKGHGHYDIFGTFIQDDSIAEAPDYQDQCLPTPPQKKKFPEYNAITIGKPGFPGFGAPVVILGTTYQFPPEIVNITIPGGSILLQAGSIEPIYPTFQGAFVFDIHYKKWGKMRQPFKRLLDYFPINDVAGDKVVPYDVFLPRGALLAADGIIYLFDQFPTDSYITYGKIGFYRKGFTQSEEIRIVNRALYNGSIILDASITSGDINPALTIARQYVAAKEFVAYAAQSGRWYNVSIEGNYDIMHLEFRGHRTGRR